MSIRQTPGWGVSPPQKRTTERPSSCGCCSSAAATGVCVYVRVVDSTETSMTESTQSNKSKRKRRWGESSSSEQPPSAATTASTDPRQRILDMKASIAAKLAAAKAKQQQLSSVKSSNSSQPPSNNSQDGSFQQQRPVKRAKTYELDMSVTGPTFARTLDVTTTETKAATITVKKPISELKKKAPPLPTTQKPSNPYLAHVGDAKEKEEDDGLARIAKSRGRKELTFVEPGKFSKIAEIKREKAALAAASGFVSGRKAGHTIKAAQLSSIYGPSNNTNEQEDSNVLKPRWDAHPDTKMPLAFEWWDAELLPPDVRKEVAAAEAAALTKSSQSQMAKLEDSAKGEEGGEKQSIEQLRNTCFSQASLSCSKTATLVQHIVPILPPHASKGPPKEAVLHLTDRERKRIRKLKREQRQREQQDLQAAGLIPAPEPRLTLSNFIRVLGDQAYLDPSQMEQKVSNQMMARQRAHWERNQASKLSKEQRATKLAKKLQEDVSTGVCVALYRVKDLRHPLLRAKIDLNAQQYNVSGAVVEYYKDEDFEDESPTNAQKSENDTIACVVLEGGPKAMKRMKRLMLARMKWSGEGEEQQQEDDNEEKEASQKFNPDNTCDLVWEGMATKRLFSGFVFQQVQTLGEAKKIFKNKGVAHYWEQVLHHTGADSALMFPSMDIEQGDDNENPNPFEEEGDDIIMRDT